MKDNEFVHSKELKNSLSRSHSFYIQYTNRVLENILQYNTQNVSWNVQTTSALLLYKTSHKTFSHSSGKWFHFKAFELFHSVVTTKWLTFYMMPAKAKPYTRVCIIRKMQQQIFFPVLENFKHSIKNKIRGIDNKSYIEMQSNEYIWNHDIDLFILRAQGYI